MGATANRPAVRHFPGTTGTINYLDGDGQNWIAGGNWAGDVCLWDIATGSVIRTMGNKELGGMQQCGLSDDRKWVASATNKKQVVVWNAENGELTKLLPMPDGCWGVEFSADSKSLVIGDGSGTLHWVSTSTWETEWTCKVGTSQINTIRISPSGDWLALGTESGQLSIIDLKTRAVRHHVQAHSERIWSLDVSPDGQRVATGSSDTRVKTWDPDSGQLLLTLADYSDAIYNVRFSSDGQSLFLNCLGGRIVQLKATQDETRR